MGGFDLKGRPPPNGRKMKVLSIEPKRGQPKYPFARMLVRDWFFVRTHRERQRALCAGNSHACQPHTQGRKYASQRVMNGYVVWRIA